MKDKFNTDAKVNYGADEIRLDEGEKQEMMQNIAESRKQSTSALWAELMNDAGFRSSLAGL